MGHIAAYMVLDAVYDVVEKRHGETVVFIITLAVALAILGTAAWILLRSMGV